MKKVILTRSALQARVASYLRLNGQTLLFDKRRKVYYIVEGERIIHSCLTLEALGKSTGLLKSFEQIESEPLRIKLIRDHHKIKA